MKATELRIGNWVKVYNQNEIVTDIVSDHQQYFIDTDKSRSIFLTEPVEPIPLTEEWQRPSGKRKGVLDCVCALRVGH